jgi:hypothetical protein
MYESPSLQCGVDVNETEIAILQLCTFALVLRILRLTLSPMAINLVIAITYSHAQDHQSISLEITVPTSIESDTKPIEKKFTVQKR